MFSYCYLVIVICVSQPQEYYAYTFILFHPLFLHSYKTFILLTFSENHYILLWKYFQIIIIFHSEKIFRSFFIFYSENIFRLLLSFILRNFSDNFYLLFWEHFQTIIRYPKGWCNSVFSYIKQEIYLHFVL